MQRLTNQLLTCKRFAMHYAAWKASRHKTVLYDAVKPMAVAVNFEKHPETSFNLRSSAHNFWKNHLAYQTLKFNLSFSDSSKPMSMSVYWRGYEMGNEADDKITLSVKPSNMDDQIKHLRSFTPSTSILVSPMRHEKGLQNVLQAAKCWSTCETFTDIVWEENKMERFLHMLYQLCLQNRGNYSGV